MIAPLDGQGDYVDGFDWLDGRNAAIVADDVDRATCATRAASSRTSCTRTAFPCAGAARATCCSGSCTSGSSASTTCASRCSRPRDTVEWEPSHIGSRMDDWLHNMGDWCISRKRYWGLPLPFYRCEDCNELTVVGSRAELRERALEPELVDALPELHRPWIDDIKIRCASCDAPAARVPEVGDCWLDAGIVPFSTLGYFDDPEGWKARFPAEWIIGDARAGAPLVLLDALHERRARRPRAVRAGAVVRARDLGDRREVLEDGPHDPLRRRGRRDRRRSRSATSSAGSRPASEARFGFEAGAQAQRRLAGLWNIASFFDTYASIDRVEMVEPSTLGDQLHVTDRWLLARTAQLVDVATAAMRREDTPTTVREFEQFVEEVSNWYVRVNRRRFWRSRPTTRDKRGVPLVVVRRACARPRWCWRRSCRSSPRSCGSR